MILVSEIKEVFRDKFSRTASFDESFTKAIWVTYERALAEGIEIGKLQEIARRAAEESKPC